MHARAKGHKCPVCHVKLKNRHGLNVHIAKEHAAKRASGLKRKPHDQSEAHDALRAKRVKVEPRFVEDIKDEVDNEVVEESKLAGESEAAGPPPAGVLVDAVAGASNDDDKEQQQTSTPVLVKAEEEEATGEASILARRLRCTVHFKTSSGSLLTSKNQTASMSFGDFRKLFCIPPDSRKLIVFKKAHGDANVSDEWIVPDGESMTLPLLDGRIMAETWTDF
ncbi:hypothetical protein AAVH_21243 [Aphelenchoides avenae]|nr:hypothetical protein AAVH_21243 [Aphelenchus avenae]